MLLYVYIIGVNWYYEFVLKQQGYFVKLYDLETNRRLHSPIDNCSEYHLTI